MQNDSLSYKTLKNVSYSFFGFAFPIVLSIITTRAIINNLGPVDYGVYLLVGTITGFMGLLDLGVTTALVKDIAEYHAKQNLPAIQKTIDSAFSLYLAVGLLGLLIYFILGKYFLAIFHISHQSQGNIFLVFLLSGIIFFIRSVNSIYTAIPQAMQRFDISTKINLAQLTFFSLATLAAVLAGYKLKVILSLNLISFLGLVIAYRIYALKLLPGFRVGIGLNFGEIKKLYKFGLFAALASIANSSLDQLDRLIIPIFLGPAALSYYSVPGNVSQKTNTIVGSMGGIFFPLASSLQGLGDQEKLKLVYKKIMRNLTVAAAGITSAIMCFGYQIIFYWLGKSGKEFADKGFVVLLILAITYFILSLYGFITNFVLGLGKVKFMALWAFILAIVNVVLLLWLMPRFGIVGAAYAYLGGVLPIIGMVYWLEKKYLLIQDTGIFYLKLYAKIFITSLLFFFLSKFILLKLVFSLISLLIVGPVSVLLYFIIYKFLGFFDQEDWDLFELFFSQVLLKLRLTKPQ